MGKVYRGVDMVRELNLDYSSFIYIIKLLEKEGKKKRVNAVGNRIFSEEDKELVMETRRLFEDESFTLVEAAQFVMNSHDERLREDLQMQADIRAEDRRVKLSQRKKDGEVYELHEAADIVGFGATIFLKYISLLVKEGRVYETNKAGVRRYYNEDIDLVLKMRSLKDSGYSLQNAAKKVLHKDIEYIGYTKTHPYKVKDVVGLLDVVVSRSKMSHCIRLLEESGYPIRRLRTHRVFSEQDVSVFREVLERGEDSGVPLRRCVEGVTKKYVG
ncbi:hypothetical protein ACTFR8_22820 [Bacillus cereus group sp. MYBK15-3]|uniref:hypothetical protein n=1 Tax=unclassified Bacillus cereus group TaxID=2750818 RepID=UPI003F7A39F3